MVRTVAPRWDRQALAVRYRHVKCVSDHAFGNLWLTESNHVVSDDVLSHGASGRDR